MCNSLAVFSHSTASALRYMVEVHGWDKEVLTTAWFLDQVNRWFDLMSSRSPTMALSLLDATKHADAVDFLNTFKHMIETAQIGGGSFKPVQAGIIMSTTSMLQIQHRLLNEEGYRFILTSRFTQDSLENFFSTVRQRNSIPTPCEFKSALRIITLAQYLRHSKHSSYADDEDSFYLGDLSDYTQSPCTPTQGEADCNEVRLNHEASEAASFEYYAGYLVSRVLKNNLTCETCAQAVQTSQTSQQDRDGGLVVLKEYKQGSLTHPSEKAVKLMEICETVFLAKIPTLVHQSQISDKLASLIKQAASTVCLPDCHHIKEKLIARFIHARLHLFAKEQTGKEISTARLEGAQSSKSMAAPRIR